MDKNPFTIVVLQEVKNNPQLTELVCKLVIQGSDNLAIGDRVFGMEKYVLTIEGQNTPRQITLWASKQGVIFGMEDSRMVPGHSNSAHPVQEVRGFLARCLPLSLSHTEFESRLWLFRSWKLLREVGGGG